MIDTSVLTYEAETVASTEAIEEKIRVAQRAMDGMLNRGQKS